MQCNLCYHASHYIFNARSCTAILTFICGILGSETYCNISTPIRYIVLIGCITYLITTHIFCADNGIVFI